MALSKEEAKLLNNVLKMVVSKVGGGTENPIRKISRKNSRVKDRLVDRPVERGKYPMYSEWAKKLEMSSWDKPVDYSRQRTPTAG